MRQVFEIGRREFPFLLKGDTNHAPDLALKILHGNCNGGLGTHRFRARFHAAGTVFLQVACLDRFAPLQRESRHPFAVWHPLDNLLHGDGDVDGGGEPKPTIFVKMNSS